MHRMSDIFVVVMASSWPKARVMRLADLRRLIMNTAMRSIWDESISREYVYKYNGVFVDAKTRARVRKRQQVCSKYSLRWQVNAFVMFHDFQILRG